MREDPFAEVFRAELQALGKPGAAAAPTADLRLAGLALSGGGIRSATYNLGVVQALIEKKLFRHFDYLSTVSGGGYLGACLHALMASGPASLEGLLADPGKGEQGPALRQLRTNSNYLAPGGLLDLLRMPALLLRGVLVHFMTLYPAILLLAVATVGIYGLKLARLPEQRYVLTPILGAVVLVFFVLSALWASLTSTGADWAKRNRSEKRLAEAILVVCAVFLLESLPALLAIYRTRERFFPHVDFDHLGSVATFLGAVFPLLFAGVAARNVGSLLGKVALWVLGILGPVAVLMVYLITADVLLDTEWGAFPVLLGVALACVAFAWPLDVNRTSLHGFYRDRLSRAYLFEVKDGVVQHADDVELAAQGGRPYHLVQATMNLQGRKDPTLLGRASDTFLFSPRYVGSAITGYCPTGKMVELDKHLNLGTAMAISGAAAAPNMGASTIKALTFVMTLLNVRLGYWLPNPRHVRENRGKLIWRWGVGPTYLLKECLGLLDADSWFVNVSDGGHSENLGIYELLRRRCKYIVASDAEADKELRFGGLVTVIRHAEIDLGTRIEIDLEDVRKDERGYSRRQCVLGTIRYPGDEIGYLLYVKSCVTGAEAEPLREYRGRNTDFPHETTADQFFDEAQFESYRALGYATMSSLLRQVQPKGEPPMASAAPYETMHGFFAAVHDGLSPHPPREDAFLELQRELGKLERAFEDRLLAPYAREIYPELEIVAPPVAGQRLEAEGVTEQSQEYARRVLHLCALQLQLMERALYELGLDRPERAGNAVHRGWMNLFRRWAKAPSFRRSCAVLLPGHSPSVQRFCESVLGIEVSVRFSAQQDQFTPEENAYLRGSKQENRFGVIAQVSPDGDEGGNPLLAVVAGVAVVDLPGPDRAVLLGMRVRRNYRRLGLAEKILAALKEEHRSRQMLYRMPGPDRPDELRAFVNLRAAFDRAGYTLEPPPPSANPEAPRAELAKER